MARAPTAPERFGPRDGADDAMLIAAIRRRLLQEIEAGGGHHSGGGGGGGGGGGHATIANNIYGGSSPYGPGVQGAMHGGGGDDDDSDYFVDILRETIPEGGEVDVDGEKRKLDAGGWRKNVHRFKKKNTAR